MNNAEAFLTKTDSWLLNHLCEFNPLGWVAEKDCFFRRKAFDELAIPVFVSLTWGPIAATALSKHLVSTVNTGSYAHLIRRNPGQLLLYSFPVLYAGAIGKLSDYTRASVDYALASPALWARERLPHRYLDLWHFCKVYGHENHLDEAQLLQLSCLGKLDPLYCSLKDAYALTHILLFYYNFGVDFPHSPIKLLPHDLEDLLCALILRFLAEDNNDIVLELLYVGAIHRQIPAVIVELVMVKINLEFKKHGHIKSPQSMLTEDLTLKNPTAKEWSENYHTMLVAAATLRYVKNNSNQTADRTNPDAPLLQCTPEQMLTYGHLLYLISQYELTKAVHIAESLLDTPLKNQTVFKSAIAFLWEQVDDQGNFGFYVEEAVKYNEQAAENNFAEDLQPQINRVFERFKAVYKEKK